MGAESAEAAFFGMGAALFVMARAVSAGAEESTATGAGAIIEGVLSAAGIVSVATPAGAAFPHPRAHQARSNTMRSPMTHGNHLRSGPGLVLEGGGALMIILRARGVTSAGVRMNVAPVTYHCPGPLVRTAWHP